MQNLPINNPRVLYASEIESDFSDCKACFVNLRERLENAANPKTSFRINKYESVNSNECSENVVLSNRFPDDFRTNKDFNDHHGKSIKINHLGNTLRLLGFRWVPDKSSGLESATKTVCEMNLHQIFYVGEIEIENTIEGNIDLEFIIYCTGEIIYKPLPTSLPSRRQAFNLLRNDDYF